MTALANASSSALSYASSLETTSFSIFVSFEIQAGRLGGAEGVLSRTRFLSGSAVRYSASAIEQLVAWRSREARSDSSITGDGQSTQLIVGADQARDADILRMSAGLYASYDLRRVYYSAFSPIPDAASGLPLQPPPLVEPPLVEQHAQLNRCAPRLRQPR